jgi:ADP-ribose pyrophosphatase YjhB (NUDIX family)
MARAGATGSLTGVIERLKEVLVFENRFVQVFNDEVRFAGGGEGTYLRIGPPPVRGPGVVIMPFWAGLIGLVESYRYPVGVTQLALPRGFGDPEDDHDPARTAARELAEEMGVSARACELIGWVTPDSGMLSTRVAVVCADVQNAEAARPDGLETTAIRWVKREELWSLVRSKSIEDGFTLSAAALAVGAGRLATS